MNRVVWDELFCIGLNRHYTARNLAFFCEYFATPFSFRRKGEMDAEKTVFVHFVLPICTRDSLTHATMIAKQQKWCCATWRNAFVMVRKSIGWLFPSLHVLCVSV